MMKNKKVWLMVASMLMISFLTKAPEAFVADRLPRDVVPRGDDGGYLRDNTFTPEEQVQKEQLQERLQAQEAARERALNLGLGDQRPTMLSGKWHRTLSTISEGDNQPGTVIVQTDGDQSLTEKEKLLLEERNIILQRSKPNDKKPYKVTWFNRFLTVRAVNKVLSDKTVKSDLQAISRTKFYQRELVKQIVSDFRDGILSPAIILERAITLNVDVDIDKNKKKFGKLIADIYDVMVKAKLQTKAMKDTSKTFKGYQDTLQAFRDGTIDSVEPKVPPLEVVPVDPKVQARIDYNQTNHAAFDKKMSETEKLITTNQTILAAYPDAKKAVDTLLIELQTTKKQIFEVADPFINSLDDIKAEMDRFQEYYKNRILKVPDDLTAKFEKYKQLRTLVDKYTELQKQIAKKITDVKADAARKAKELSDSISELAESFNVKVFEIDDLMRNNDALLKANPDLNKEIKDFKVMISSSAQELLRAYEISLNSPDSVEFEKIVSENIVEFNQYYHSEKVKIEKLIQDVIQKKADDDAVRAIASKLTGRVISTGVDYVVAQAKEQARLKALADAAQEKEAARLAALEKEAGDLASARYDTLFETRALRLQEAERLKALDEKQKQKAEKLLASQKEAAAQAARLAEAARKKADRARKPKPAIFGSDINAQNPLKTTKIEPVELKKAGLARELATKVKDSLTSAAKKVGENIKQTIENGTARK